MLITMRGFFDWIYKASGAAGAVCVASICLTVVLQVIANVINSLTGQFSDNSTGLLVPSYAEFTGFLLVAASFFSLAYTFRASGHIRVTLVLRYLGVSPRRWVECFCLLVGASLTGYFSWYAFRLVWDSFQFGDLAFGMIPLPLWIPQSAMVLGSVALFIALLDDLVRAIAGHSVSYGDINDFPGPNKE